MVRARRLGTLAGAVLALALISSSASLAGSRTTAPGKNVLVYFVINDKEIRYQIYRETAGGGASDLTLEKYVLRGDFARFFVINRGKARHGFAFLGNLQKQSQLRDIPVVVLTGKQLTAEEKRALAGRSHPRPPGALLPRAAHQRRLPVPEHDRPGQGVQGRVPGLLTVSAVARKRHAW